MIYPFHDFVPANIVVQGPSHDAAGLSIKGPRPYQEDAAVLFGNRYAVFDGLGGHAGGDLASTAGVRGFLQVSDSLEESLQHATSFVLEAQRQAPEAMTTVVAAEVHPNHVRVGWAGDSRIYLLRRRTTKGPAILRLSRDHAIPGTHIVSRCLGSNCEPEFAQYPTIPGDVLLLCSDGLHNAVPAQKIGLALLQGGTATQMAARLLELALANPCDNTTLVVVQT